MQQRGSPLPFKLNTAVIANSKEEVVDFNLSKQFRPSIKEQKTTNLNSFSFLPTGFVTKQPLKS